MKRAQNLLAIGAATVGLLFTGTSTASAEAINPSASPSVYIVCKVKPNRVHESRGSHGFIVGKSQFWCNHRIDSLVNVAKLQKKVHGGWHDVTKAKARSIPKPKAGHKYRNQNKPYKCRKGTFRLATMGHGVYRGVPSKSRHWQYSEPVKNPCS